MTPREGSPPSVTGIRTSIHPAAHPAEFDSSICRTGQETAELAARLRPGQVMTPLSTSATARAMITVLKANAVAEFTVTRRRAR